MSPSPASKNSSGMSFMPKGSSLSMNIRRVKDESLQLDNHAASRNFIPQQDDFNESNTSDDGSKYSYEDSGDDMDQELDEKYGRNIGSILSPTHSTYESPDALDVNNMVQLSSKFPSKRDIASKSSPLHNLREKETPSLSLRKIGQPTSLKPLQAAQKKKMSPKKKTKNIKSLNSPKHDIEESEKMTEVAEEQRNMLEAIRKEWLIMQEEFEKEEKAKYEKMIKESSKKLEEEESVIKKEHDVQISKLKNELDKKVKEEQSAAETSLNEIKKSNEVLYTQEEQVFKQKMDALVEEKNIEINKMKEKKDSEISEKKIQLDDEIKKEIENVMSTHENKLKELKETHSMELDLLERAHAEEVNKMKEKTEIKTEKTSELNQDIDSKKEEHQRLLNELNDVEKKIETKNDALLKLEEKIAASQTYYEEIQDEVDKTENDLDLLRTEKSTLISELSILKENIKNEKSNSLNKENITKSIEKVKCENRTTNTEVFITTSKQIQTLIDSIDASSQTVEIFPIKLDKHSQASEIKVTTFEKDSQTNSLNDSCPNFKTLSSPKVHNSDAQEIDDINVIISRSLENALSNMTSKIDERFKYIEKHIGSLSQNDKIFDHKASTSGISNQVKQNQNPEINTASGAFDLNVPQGPNVNSIFTIDSYNRMPATSSHESCGCERGDIDSCDIMQDVKSSIYRLNDIIGQNYMPALNNTDVINTNQPLGSYSNSMDTFYAQFRQLQERHRIINLKHRCQNEVNKHLKNPMSLDRNQLKNMFKPKDYSKPNNIESSTLYPNNSSEDVMTRARNLILQEKAGSLKLKQLQNSRSFFPQENNYPLSDNVSFSMSSRTSPRISEVSPYLNFESDPETDYNSWMLRLNTLQQKIRSHKFV